MKALCVLFILVLFGAVIATAEVTERETRAEERCLAVGGVWVQGQCVEV